MYPLQLESTRCSSSPTIGCCYQTSWFRRSLAPPFSPPLASTRRRPRRSNWPAWLEKLNIDKHCAGWKCLSVIVLILFAYLFKLILQILVWIGCCYSFNCPRRKPPQLHPQLLEWILHRLLYVANRSWSWPVQNPQFCAPCACVCRTWPRTSRVPGGFFLPRRDAFVPAAVALPPGREFAPPCSSSRNPRMSDQHGVCHRQSPAWVACRRRKCEPSCGTTRDLGTCLCGRWLCSDVRKDTEKIYISL